MAYEVESSTLRRYVGLSTDEKPVTEESVDTVPVGSYLQETDTGLEWRWTGLEWRLATGPGSDEAKDVEERRWRIELLAATRELVALLKLLIGNLPR